jgi:hypothetical protein
MGSKPMRCGAWLLCLTGLVACAPANSADDRPMGQPSVLCADDARKGARSAIRNDERRTVGEILAIAPASLAIRYASADWYSAGDVARRIRDFLQARPRALSSSINWAERTDFARESFVANLYMPDGAMARLDAAGYQACLRDARGGYWYFRNVPADLWPGFG